MYIYIYVYTYVWPHKNTGIKKEGGLLVSHSHAYFKLKNSKLVTHVRERVLLSEYISCIINDNTNNNVNYSVCERCEIEAKHGDPMEAFACPVKECNGFFYVPLDAVHSVRCKVIFWIKYLQFFSIFYP